MSRTLSSSMLRALYAEESGDYPILLITLTHPTLTQPIRVSSDPTQRIAVSDAEVVYGTVSRGNTYVYIPFSIALPNDSAEEAPHTSISLDNIGRDLVPTIRNLNSPPTVLLEWVMSSAPDTVEADFPGFALGSITYDALTISGEITVDGLVGEPCPSGTMNPSDFPGLF